ncbi:MAG: four helix bundle protein [Candidatus Marinimicrobia bacterium]|nr:four helix bundle protein [Candidatus Neomarinimicrobiota bacterium]
MKKDNVVQQKSYSFALRIIKLYKYLTEEKREFVISKQILRSGTSIGANVEESLGGSSDKDFIHKLTIAYKEARETRYWLRLLRESEYLTPEMSDSILDECDELLKIIGSIQSTMKKKTRRITN